MTEIKSADPQKLAEHLRKCAKSTLDEARAAYFRPPTTRWSEMYAVRAKRSRTTMKGQ